MPPFYGWGSTASRLQPLRGSRLLFTTKFPKILGTQFIDLGRMKGWLDPGATQWFWIRDLWIGNPTPSPIDHCFITKIILNNKGEFLTNPKDIVNYFNNFFCSVASTIQSNIKPTFKSFHHYLTEPRDESFHS